MGWTIENSFMKCVFHLGMAAGQPCFTPLEAVQAQEYTMVSLLLQRKKENCSSLWCALVVSWVCGHLSQIEGKWKSTITDQGVKNSESSGSYQVENLILLMLGAVHKGQLLMMSAMPYMVLWHHADDIIYVGGGHGWVVFQSWKGMWLCLLWT